MKKKKVYMMIATAAIVIGIAVFAGAKLSEVNKITSITRKTDSGNESAAEGTTGEDDFIRDSFDGSVTYKGQRYEINTKVDTVLFLGIDTSNQTREGIGIDEGGRSDTIILFAIDNEKQQITPLEINRDSMVDVDIYDNDGNYLTTGKEQLTMQYSYGRNPMQASNLTREKVSDLLGRTRIDSVISLTMEGIEPIVDSIGGVTLKLEDDHTDIDPAYTKGAVITLDGQKAYDFVHTRDVTIRGSNMNRMSRQTQFMMALFNTIHGKGSSIIETMENSAGDYLYEDIDADSVDHLSSYDYSGTIMTLPGENVTEGVHDEFYIDDKKLLEVVLELFYKKV